MPLVLCIAPFTQYENKFSQQTFYHTPTILLSSVPQARNTEKQQFKDLTWFSSNLWSTGKASFWHMCECLDPKVLIYNHPHNSGGCFCAVIIQTFFLPSLASGLEFLIYAENLAKMSIPAVFDSGCFGESFKYLNGKVIMY